MIAQSYSATLVGIDAVPIVIEVDLQGGIQGDGERYFVLVGLPDVAVRESKERVRTAIKYSGIDFPMSLTHKYATRVDMLTAGDCRGCSWLTPT